ncbi:MAG: M35 family metallo-endopeptidase [Arenimonas sp.]
MKLSKRNIVLAAGLVALTGFAFTAQSARTIPFGNPLRISVSPEASNNGVVQFKITNTSKQAVQVPTWQLPSGALDSDLFSVYLNGKKVEYVGKMVKRGPLTDADFITLRAGETKLVTADLSSVYDLTADGDYSISFKSYLQGAKNDKGQALTSSNGRMAYLQTPAMRMHVESAPATIDSLQLEKRSNSTQGKKPPTGGSVVINGVTLAGCSSTQQTQAGTAVVNARTYTQNALNYLTAGTTGPRYTTWFGSYTSSRYNTVRSHFSSIDTAMDQGGGAIKINCACSGSEYAHVYPNRPYEIFVCRAFWPAPATGTDSKAGTLIHEMSHFDIVANTDDVVYGQTGAKNLAISNPDDAVRNADSHEYFSENTPNQN